MNENGHSEPTNNNKKSGIRGIRSKSVKINVIKKNDIYEYLRIISECDIMCPLEFWKKWQNHLPALAKIAKKYLGVQASSAVCKRSTAGQIYSFKRRRMSVLLFTTLIFFKLKQQFL